MNESIKQLLSLQERDVELDRYRADLAAIPKKIATIRETIAGAKLALENAKKDLTQLQLVKKQKELDLAGQENAVRKHTGELNSVKTNEAYRALQGEIDKAKKEQSGLEDQILQNLEQTDVVMKIWKDKESVSKSDESARLGEISEWESKQKSIEQNIIEKQEERDQAAKMMSESLMAHYDKLRNGGRGQAVVLIEKEQCGGCHMRVSQNLINEVRRGQKLMTCESCSRIVYLEDVPVAPK